MTGRPDFLLRSREAGIIIRHWVRYCVVGWPRSSAHCLGTLERYEADSRAIEAGARDA